MYPIAFVSLGPGEAELITVKALKILQQADAIFYPTTKRGGKTVSRAHDIMRQLGISSVSMKPFFVPMSKDRTAVLEVYEQMATRVSQLYVQGHRVAIVAEGDSGFYTTTYYISERLVKKHIPIERIAGVPAFIAAGALGKLHIAALEQELHVIPGTVSATDLQERIIRDNVVVVMKTSLCQAEIKKCMQEYPTVADYHYFENVGVAEKEFYTSNMDIILNRDFPYFSIMIIQKRNK